MKKTKKLLVRFTMIMIMMMTIIMILVMAMVMVSVMALVMMMVSMVIDGDINYRMKAANPGWDETACPGAV